jgi:hypothetical protein
MVVASIACRGEGASKWHDDRWRTAPQSRAKDFDQETRAQGVFPLQMLPARIQGQTHAHLCEQFHLRIQLSLSTRGCRDF